MPDPRETQDVEGALGRLYDAGGHLVPTRIEPDREDPDKLLKIPTRVEWMTRRIAEVVRELGLQPWKLPDPLDPIEEEEVNLAVWMGVMEPGHTNHFECRKHCGSTVIYRL